MEEPFFFATQDAFSAWLEDHSGSATALWVGYFVKGSGRPSMSWPESVDVALCYGWIDGVRKSIDGQSYKIRFTPRKSASVWSAVNVQKVQALIRCGRMRPEGLRLFNARRDKDGYSPKGRDIPLDPALEAQIRANASAWIFFSSLPPSSKRDSIWWVMSAKKEETRSKRMGILIASSQNGLKVPMLRKSGRPT